MEKTLLENNNFLKDLFDTIPLMILVVDNDVQILYWNLEASTLFGKKYVYKTRAGEVLKCMHSTDGCGKSKLCKNCIIRNSVNLAIQGDKVYRRKTIMKMEKEASEVEFPMAVSATPFKYENETYSILILEDLRDIVELRSFLPICANCKKIRNDEEYWEEFEVYAKSHLMDIEFSHGICPDCLKILYPKYFK